MAEAIRKGRTEAALTQAELGKRIGSSQARVAKMEGGDPQASLESMMRALAATGYRARVTNTRATCSASTLVCDASCWGFAPPSCEFLPPSGTVAVSSIEAR